MRLYWSAIFFVCSIVSAIIGFGLTVRFDVFRILFFAFLVVAVNCLILWRKP